MEFLQSVTPTVGDLVDNIRLNHGWAIRPPARTRFTINTACTNLSAREFVHREVCPGNAIGPYGHISTPKPNNVVRILCTKTSLALVCFPSAHHIIRRYANSTSSFPTMGRIFLRVCETRANWRFIRDEGDKFCNLFGSELAS